MDLPLDGGVVITALANALLRLFGQASRVAFVVLALLLGALVWVLAYVIALALRISPVAPTIVAAILALWVISETHHEHRRLMFARRHGWRA
jgi:hypothetical protein